MIGKVGGSRFQGADAGAVENEHSARPRASQGQHLLPCAGAEGDAVGDGRGLQRPQRARLLAVGVGLGQVGLAHVLDQHTPAREHLHEPGDDGLQQRVPRLVAGRTDLDEAGQTVGVAPIHPVQHEAVQVDVEVGGRAEALDRRDGAAMAFIGLETGRLRQMTRDHALHHLQHRRDQLGLRGQQLVVAALAAAQPQEAMGKDAAFEEGVELGLAGRVWPVARPFARHEQSTGLFVSGLSLDEARQFGAGAGLGVRDEAGRVLLHQAVQRGLLRAMALAVERNAIRRRLGLPVAQLGGRLPGSQIARPTGAGRPILAHRRLPSRTFGRQPSGHSHRPCRSSHGYYSGGTDNPIPVSVRWGVLAVGMRRPVRPAP
ncbi:MAG: hypothetical protein IPQ21_05900 [Betaproteobacteria bacterium]|nr:hypothetical protein [Betaproteobacteria bacterium]